MPSQLAKKPPKADVKPDALTLDEAIARSHALVDRVLAAFPVVATIGLFSGGNDSVVVNHLFRHRVDAIAHVNTGTGIPETTQHVRDVVTTWGLPLHELHPKHSYADLVMGRVLSTRGKNIGRQVWKGFPGPAGHTVMYRRLKDEPLQRLRAQIVGRHWRTRNVVYLGGMRWAETDRRFRNAEEVDKEGSLIWVSPIVHWTDAHMREYRARHRCDLPHEHAEHRLCTPDALPLNEVTAHLHMSGECLCGAYAKPGELDEIEFFYPHAAAPLRQLEKEAKAAGLPACKWGQRPPGTRTPKGPAGRLCSSCTAPDGQTDLLADWRDSGLITSSQYDTFTRQDTAA
ncbi:phosphoadenosine phosphosulfate reductase domain-containing protein [Streptomyces demainii]|uniref:3'-phosphoadenosine 5'-phosphosulfate sulfotransferase (PAPS reductase)/FAD synthetase n=1 Tax=Streptomyces demainii TaxID=588122 RepID=A0ABT9KME5_9ACTN|nr:phosphoadenosine phosphosulfate reductase family protein [Streptomyces demainii]MDP9609586.1 3'-phosphoadenosine 5'-phosphosulfate sulfotransferase (PAPS reductase)/FAD synthetase [Streptomyces demainii]